MSDQADTLVIKPASIEINNHSNGTVHENGTSHSPSKSMKVKNEPIENGPETNSTITATTSNGHHPTPSSSVQPNVTDHIYETPSNLDGQPPLSFETPTVSSSDEQGHKSDENNPFSSSSSTNEHHSTNGIDSGLASDTTNATNSGTETEKTNFDDELSTTSVLTSSSIISAARLLETNIVHANDKREASPTSGVIIPEEKRVTDRVKVFEAAANHDQSAMKKQPTKNGHQKKSPNHEQKSTGKREQQISPSLTSASESIETQLTNESKPSPPATTTSKSKSKRPSLKKQIQNLLKIDKPSSPDESTITEEQSTITNGKKTNPINTTRTKPNNGKTNFEIFLWKTHYSSI